MEYFSFCFIALVMSIWAGLPELNGDPIIHQPVLWRAVDVPITSGHNSYNLVVEFKSPCAIFTEDLIHADLLMETRMRCEDLYEEYFLSELEIMCPSGSFDIATSEHNRQKRFLFNLIFKRF